MSLCVCVCVCMCVCLRLFVRARVGGWNLTEDANIHFVSQAMTSLLRMGSECSLCVYKDTQPDPSMELLSFSPHSHAVCFSH